MTLSPLVRRLPLLSLASALALSALAPLDALAAGPRPPFQLPTPCGQTWRASTYEAHWNGDQDALDLAQRDENQANLSDGEFALAAAAGTVQSVYTNGAGEHRVFLDHGNGWRTDYIHLKELPPLTVGQQIAQGEVVGIVSNSGASSPHLHYNQMADGTPVRAAFNGELVDTHAGNMASWGTYGSASAEALTSVNCAGDSFGTFTLSGVRYQILYKPSTGETKFMQLDADGTGVTTAWTGDWGQRWTLIVPFDLSNGQQNLFRYKASTGEFRFDRINASAQGITNLSSGTWWAGWTQVTPFTLGGNPYFLVYDQLHGYANIERVNASGNGTTNISSSTWTKGWTHFVPYTLGSTQYLLLYKSGSGAVEVNSITGSGNSVTLTETWSSTWTTGWSHLVPITHQGNKILFSYRANTGQVNTSRFLANGQGTTYLGAASWTTTWTSFTPMTLSNGDGGIFIYRGSAGTAQARQLSATGDSSSEIWSGSWTTGWR